MTCVAVIVSLGCSDKVRELSGLNNKHLFLTALEAGKSKIKVPVDLVSGEGTPPGLQRALFLLYPHVAKRGRERE